VFKGSGIEFEEVREYIRGDDVRSIDWNVTARTGKLFVKKFSEERELTVLLLIDVSGSQDFGSKTHFKKELATELAAVLSLSAVKSKDKIGLVLFSDRIEKFIPPKKGRTHVLRIIREVLAFKPVSRKTNLNAALAYVNGILKRRAILFLISDFFDKDYEKDIQISARKNDLIPVILRDRLEEEIPNMGLVAFEDGESGKISYVDTASKAFRKKYKKKCEKRDREQVHKMLSINMDSIIIRTGSDYINQLLSFFKKRAGRY